jgi:hypothetical protein
MVMVNLNDELYKEISELIRNNSIDYPTIKNFVEKAAKKEMESFKSEKGRMDKSRLLFDLFAGQKRDEIKKLIPELSDNSFSEIAKALRKANNL